MFKKKEGMYISPDKESFKDELMDFLGLDIIHGDPLYGGDKGSCYSLGKRIISLKEHVISVDRKIDALTKALNLEYKDKPDDYGYPKYVKVKK